MGRISIAIWHCRLWRPIIASIWARYDGSQKLWRCDFVDPPSMASTFQPSLSSCVGHMRLLWLGTHVILRPNRTNQAWLEVGRSTAGAFRSFWVLWHPLLATAVCTVWVANPGAITLLEILYLLIELHSPKLTKHLKIDGWNATVPLEWQFLGAMLVTGRVQIPNLQCK